MWGIYSQNFQLNKSQFNETEKKNQNLLNLNNIEINQLFQTPIKQIQNFSNIINSNPFHYDYNTCFGNLWSSGHIPNNPFEPSLNITPTQINKDNFIFSKKYMDKSNYKLTSISPINDSDNSKHKINNSKLNNMLGEKIENKNLNTEKYSNVNKDFTKKNLVDIFNGIKKEPILIFSKNEEININPNKNSEQKKNINDIILKNNEQKKFTKLQISRQYIFNSPEKIKKPRKIFECSSSTICTNSSNQKSMKKRRFRKK